MPPEQVKELLLRASALLRKAGAETPELDARLLLQAASGLTREDIILWPEREIAPDRLSVFQAFLERRQRREPVSRILGEREFYGRPFQVTPDVLDPRPDTETLIDAALGLMGQHARILDLGTGTGAIAITLLAERPAASGVAVDVSPAALQVARANAALLGVADRLTLVEGSWFSAVTGVFDIIASNPPYIREGDIPTLSPDVRNFDPGLALVGGIDGFDGYREIASGASAHLKKGGHVLVEIGAGQASAIVDIFAAERFALVGAHADLGGQPRCLVFSA